MESHPLVNLGMKGSATSSKESDESWSMTDYGKRAEAKISVHPFDLDSWEVLLREAQTATIVRSRAFYEHLVTQFPTSARYWRMYIEQEMRHRCYEEVEKLFQRCLMDILHIDLWKLYITYIRETKSGLPNYREKLKNAYDFTLEHMGIDFYSTPIWMEYLDFLNSENSQGSYGENLKLQSMRKTFQLAVASPKVSIEQVWKDYSAFENMANKSLAKKVLEVQNKLYSNAKRASYEYENVTRGLVRGSTSVPPQGAIQEAQQLQIWRRYLAWEKQNPLRTEDVKLIIKRVVYAYNQCLLCFGHCSDIWYELTLYLQRAGESDPPRSHQWIEEAGTVYTRAVSGPLANNLLMNFAFADFEEVQQHNDKAESIYNRLLSTIEDESKTLVYIQYMNFKRRTAGIKGARTVFKKAREDTKCNYHAYVAAALMEYYITKDKDIAFRIFELGMKKFGTNVGFLLAYVDYLSHLNDDNNTRVLFEKAVSTVPPDESSKLWEQFSRFELAVGDLSSLLKVERRRANMLQRSQEAEVSETSLLIDRYTYLDLFPCSELELRVIGHHSVANPIDTATAPVFLKAPVSNNESSKADSHYSKPDLKQMISFKPSTTHGVGMNAVPGGHFPLPSSLANLLSLLPPPHCFQGPFVQVDQLIDMIIHSSIPEISSSQPGLSSTRVINQKRRRDDGEDFDEETAPPSNDLYISRQQKRAQTT
ncbi:PREDICTED: cleavage stimulation factor subunit 3 [Amphimedon queenslandica]|uniref:Suppressor of forked domain-containing protein n=1 Tax=Amphimedon queenslandica TaxID=400682 RepID=A0A1X7VP66_AMPQE|nr:PREDICTED: cleavage stimulation factor subunit 3 [Amphimedon queenslandica]|eukprot:XP_019857540.1 PREDICTED: cleavage stimulation factor subunit 3 [Amphimedon queenslandica]